MKDREFQDWLLHVFDHPVADPEWYWASDAAVLRLPPAQAVEALGRLFEQAGELLDGLPDERAAQGLWYLVSAADYLQALGDPMLPQAPRLKALHAIEHLFRDLFAKRCSPALTHLREPGKPLNEICFLWWDAVPFSARFWSDEAAFFGKACLAVMERTLEIPHDAVREGALHGLALWHPEFPEDVRRIVTDFVQRTPDLRAELLDFAAGAAQGAIS